MEISLRKISNSDNEFIHSMIEKNLKYVIDSSFKGMFNYGFYINKMNIEGCCCIIIYNGNKCGFVWYTINNNDLHVNTIVIDEKYQNMGIGKKVFVEVEKVAKDLNVSYIRLGVQGVNKKAKQFYENLGFIECGYFDEFDTYFMQKKV